MVPAEDTRVRLGWPNVGEAELAEVAAVLESGMLTMGPKVGEFEAEIARLCEVEHALVVTSGTAALHLAVLALGLEPGDEVLVPAYTFPAMVEQTYEWFCREGLDTTLEFDWTFEDALLAHLASPGT